MCGLLSLAGREGYGVPDRRADVRAGGDCAVLGFPGFAFGPVVSGLVFCVATDAGGLAFARTEAAATLGAGERAGGCTDPDLRDARLGIARLGLDGRAAASPYTRR